MGRSGFVILCWLLPLHASARPPRCPADHTGSAPSLAVERAYTEVARLLSVPLRWDALGPRSPNASA